MDIGLDLEELKLFKNCSLVFETVYIDMKVH